jgi:hypothetical protein
MAAGSILTGELGFISLFDLGQLLMLNGATGELVVTRDKLRVFLFFSRGQIVNAVDEDRQEGEEAAYRIFAWKQGTYEFRPGSEPASMSIACGTEGLMMEAARRMDEDPDAAHGVRASAADRLAQRANSLEALRQAFQSVASETRSLPDAEDAHGSPFALLREPGDALLLRPGHAPRVRAAGAWRAAGTHALDTGAFEQLRSKLAGSDRSGDESQWVTTWDDGRAYAVTHVPPPHESLWIRAAAVPAPGVAALDGPLDAWRGVTGAGAGLLLVTAADPEVADFLFHACVAGIAGARPGLLALAADHRRWLHADGVGAVIHLATPAGSAAFAAADVAAFDLAHADASAAALQSSPRVVAAILAPAPGAALARWCARTGRRAGDGIEALLAGTRVDVVHSDGTRGADGRLRFGVARLALEGSATVAVTPAPAPATPAAPAAPAAAAPPRAARGAKKPAAASSAPPPAPAAATPAEAPAATPADAAPNSADPMAALAAELKRSLDKAA